ncbi:tetratricopeptide repeat protein, partial [Gottfriedia acidiceleris]
YYNMQMFDQAIADFNKAIDLDQKDYLVFNDRGLAYQSKQMYDQA